jgi:hypothetical protein
MKTKVVTITGVLCLSLLFCPRIFGQSLLTQAYLSGGGGINVITNSLNLAIGFSTNESRNLIPALFNNVWVQTGNVGQVYTLRPGDDPVDFAQFTHYLTDGTVSYFGYEATVGPGGGGRSGIPEVNFFSYLPPGNNGIDLGGFDIAYYSLVFTALEFDSPGSNPNMNGQWTDFSYSATFSVFGEPVPEPASLTLLCLILGVLLAITPLSDKSQQATRTGADGRPVLRDSAVAVRVWWPLAKTLRRLSFLR